MGNISERIIFDDSEVIKSLQTQIDLTGKVNQALRQMEDAYKEMGQTAQAQVDVADKALEDGKNKIFQHITETNKAKAASAGWGGALKSLAGEINVMGVNLGQTVSQLKAKAAAMKAAVTGVNAGTNALKIFKIAMISTGIGALIVAVGSLIAFFAKTEKGAEKLEVVMAGVGAVISVITDRIAKFGEAVFKFLSGDLKGAAADAKAAFAGIGAEIGNEVKALTDLKKREQELEDNRRKHREEQAKGLEKIKKLQLDSDNNLLSDAKRLAAIKEAGAIELANQKRLNELDAEDQAIAEARYDLGAKTDADHDKVIDKREQAALSNIESLTLQKKIQSQTQGIQSEMAAKEKERLAIQKELNDALDDQVKKIESAIQAAELSRLSESEKILFQEELAKKEIDLLFKVLEEKAKAAGKEVDFAEDKKNLLLYIEEQKNKKLQELRQEDLDNERKIRNETAKDREEFAKKEADKRAKEIEDQIKKSGDVAINSTSTVESAFGDFLEGISVKIGNVFGVETQEEINDVLKSIGQSVSSIFDSMTAATGAAIEKNQELIESLKDQEDEANDQLEKEKERAEAGLANNLSAKEKEIQEIKKQQIAAEKDAEKLRKKQVAAQLLADTIAQGSNILTMITNVTASPGVSLLGPAGIPIALAVIAAFMAIIGKAKASQKKLYTGGSLDQEGITGFVNLSGRSDKGSGRGHAVEDSNLVLGGKEFVMNEDASSEHSDFLHDMNRGKFSGKDLRKEISERGLHFAIAHNNDHAYDKALIAEAASMRKDDRLAVAIDQSVAKHIGRLEKTIKAIPRKTAYRPGDIIIEETESGKKIIQTEPPWQWKP